MNNIDIMLTKAIKILLVTILCIMLTIASIFIMPLSYAIADNVVEIPLVQSGGTPSTTTMVNNGTLIYSGNAFSSDVSIYVGTTLEDKPVYCGLYLNSSNYLYAVFAYDTSISGVNAYACKAGGTVSNINFNTATITSSTSAIQYSVGQYAIGTNTSNYTYEPFTSYQDFVDAIDYIPAGNTDFERTITIKPGYVAYAQTNGGTLDLIAQFPNYSKFSRPLWDDHVRIAFGGYYAPTSGTIFNDSFGNSVDWLKPASADTNILGQTKIGGKYYSAGLPDNGSCVVIYNPAYIPSTNTNDLGRTIPAPTITAKFSNLVFVTQYPLNTSISYDTTNGVNMEGGSPTGYDDMYLYTPSADDSTTIVSDTDYYFYDRTDNISSPAITIPSGGYNTLPNDSSAVIEQGENTLNSLIDRILSLLSAPITHIKNLFNTATAFFVQLSQLWAWLPPEVVTVLSSALIVLIVIGVIKFLWK